MNREPFSIIFRQDCILVTAVLENADDIKEFDRAFAVVKRGRAQAIEAGTAETGTGSVHESAVPQGMRPDPSSTHQENL